MCSSDLQLGMFAAPVGKCDKAVWKQGASAKWPGRAVDEKLRKQVFLEGRNRGQLGVKDQWVTPLAEGGFLERAR